MPLARFNVDVGDHGHDASQCTGFRPHVNWAGMLRRVRSAFILLAIILAAPRVSAQTAIVAGVVHDETSGVLPGVSVELRTSGGTPETSVTDGQGRFRFERVGPGHYQMSFTLINFATVRREVNVSATGTSTVDAVMHLTLNADVTVTGKRTFANLADVENPAENIVGVAQSASQGAITAKQLEVRPLSRSGEVL